jgi:hypothetical protein
MVKSQIFKLIPAPSFDHNSCKSSRNEQCKGILSIYVSRHFQWCLTGLIWHNIPFSTKVLNIHNSYTSATPKMLMSLDVWIIFGFCGNWVNISKLDTWDYSTWRGEVKKVSLFTFLVTRDTRCSHGQWCLIKKPNIIQLLNYCILRSTNKYN